MKEKRNSEKIFIWVIKPNSTIHFTEITLPKDITQLISNLRQSLRADQGRNSRRGDKSNKKTKEDKEIDKLSKLITEKTTITDSKKIEENHPSTSILQELYQLLFQPIIQWLPERNEKEKVIIIPDRELFLLPFHCLHDGKEYSFKISLSILPSLQILKLLRNHHFQSQEQQPQQKQMKIILIGNPNMPINKGKQLDSLPGAELEVKEIYEIMKEENPMIWIKEKATKSSILPHLKESKIIHFATHGLLDYEGGGALALSPSQSNKQEKEENKDDNGILTAQEIYSLELSQEPLVILSACDTGNGEICADGVIGLGRSFLSAGASSLIVSLWPVDDYFTRKIMINFYEQLKNNPSQDPSLSLRQSMLSLLHVGPECWGPFIFIG